MSGTVEWDIDASTLILTETDVNSNPFGQGKACLSFEDEARFDSGLI